VNGRKAKRIRKIIYEGLDYRDREYGLVLQKEVDTPYADQKGKTITMKWHQVLNVGQLENVGTKAHPKEFSKRRIYQYAKKQMKGIKYVNLEDAILN